MIYIPGSWSQVLMVAFLLFILASLIFHTVRGWRRRRERERVLRSYSRYLVGPDYRDATAIFHRLRRAQFY